MERGVVHYNHGTFIKGWQKLVGKPRFKKAAIHCSAILEWSKDFICHFSGNNTAAFIFSAADPSKHRLAADRVPIFTVQVGIDSAFIHIGDLF